MSSFLRKNSRFFAGALVGAALLYWFSRSLNFREVLHNFRTADFTLILAAATLTMATYVLRSYRWRTFLAPIRHASIKNLFAATVIGFSGVFAFGRAGEVVRPVVCSMRERIRPAATFATIMIERVYDMVAIVIFFALNLFFLDRIAIAREHEELVRSVKWTGIILLLASAAGIYGLTVFRKKSTGVLAWVERKLASAPRRFSRSLLNLLDHVSDGLSVLQDARALSVTAAQTVLIWSAVVGVTWLVIRAFGVSMPVTGTVFVMSFALVGSLVPTPGGAAGPFHTAAAVALLVLGVDRNKAASIAIIFHLVAFGPATIFGLYYLFREGLSISSLRALGDEIADNPQDVTIPVEEPEAVISA